MKLTYFFCECVDDHPCYGIVAKTKRQATLERDARGVARFLAPAKRTIQAADMFELMDLLTGEGGGRGYSNA